MKLIAKYIDLTVGDSGVMPLHYYRALLAAADAAGIAGVCENNGHTFKSIYFAIKTINAKITTIQLSRYISLFKQLNTQRINSDIY